MKVKILSLNGGLTRYADGTCDLAVGVIVLNYDAVSTDGKAAISEYESLPDAEGGDPVESPKKKRGQ
jgi:hypothetical protein